MSTATLSPAVIRVSGALETVLRDVEKYADQPLNKKSQTAIARLVELRPDLNDEQSIAKLVDLSAFHGVSQMTRLGKQIDDYGLPAVHLAVDYLYELGERGKTNDKTTEFVTAFGETRPYLGGMDSVDNVAELITQLAALTGTAIESTEHLSDLIAGLGGLEAALTMSSHVLANAVAAEFKLGADVENDAEDDEPVSND